MVSPHKNLVKEVNSLGVRKKVGRILNEIRSWQWNWNCSAYDGKLPHLPRCKMTLHVRQPPPLIYGFQFPWQDLCAVIRQTPPPSPLPPSLQIMNYESIFVSYLSKYSRHTDFWNFWFVVFSCLLLSVKFLKPDWIWWGAATELMFCSTIQKIIHN